MNTVLQFILDLFRNENAAQAFVANPNAALADAGLADVTPQQLQSVAATAVPGLELAPADPIAGLQQAVSNQFGFAPVESVLPEVGAGIVTDQAARTTARNHLWGEVTRIHEGPVSSEVTITLPGGRNLTAMVTHDSIGALELAVGTAACAVFQATSVILAVFD